MLTVAYFTQDTAYEKEADLLIASLKRAGMRYDVVGVPSKGDWYDNTAYKATFLCQMRSMYSGPLLYVDVDAFVHSNCDKYFEGLAAKRIDFGAHFYRGPAKGMRRQIVAGVQGWRMLSGTMFLGDTIACRRLLEAWMALNTAWRGQGIREGGGQKNLWFTHTCLQELRVERLPGSYCYVFDRAFAYLPHERPIIEHTNASRDHRAVERKTEGRAKRRMELSKLVEPNFDGMKRYWVERYKKQGLTYVAHGGRLDSYKDQYEALVPVLQEHVRGPQVLDFGCGPGRFQQVLAEGREYTGVDLIPGLGTRPLGRHLEGKYDTIVSILVLQHITDQLLYEHWTQEIYRALKPGGRLLVVDHDRLEGMQSHMNPRGLEGLEPLGWETAEVVGRYGSHWIGLLTKPGRQEDVPTEAGAHATGDGAHSD